MINIQTQILDRISQGGRGKVFTPKDFLDLGSREAVDKGLSRLAKAGDIQRLGRGLYHFPRKNARLGIPLSPDADENRGCLGTADWYANCASGATAANRLGLSTQVPAKPVYLTDGRCAGCGLEAWILWSSTLHLGTSRREAGPAQRCFRRFAIWAETP